MRHTTYTIRYTLSPILYKNAFTLVETLIVVAILGILAAVVIPAFRDYTTKAKESAAKESLFILRSAIERYAAQHNGVPPGYPGDNTDAPPLYGAFYIGLVRNNYISEIPKNPFNGLQIIQMIGDDETFPEAPTGNYGWVYQPQSKTIRLDWPGADSREVNYFDY